MNFLSRLISRAEPEQNTRPFRIERKLEANDIKHARWRKISEAYANGENIHVVLSEFRVSGATLYKALRFTNTPLRAPARGAIPSPALAAARVARHAELEAAALAKKENYERRVAEKLAIVQRDQSIADDYHAGLTSQNIGDKLGITRERVCQVLRRNNIIEHVKERKRIAREALAQESAEIKERVRAERQERLTQALALIREGQSIRAAHAQVGLPIVDLNTLKNLCRLENITLQHGRHRDFSRRDMRVRELHSEGKNRDEIVRLIRAEGDTTLHKMWIANNCSDLKFPRRGSWQAARPADHATEPKVKKEPEPVLDWTAERVSTLCTHWLAGLSAQHIVDIFGPPLTRNMVIGKVNRLRAAGQLQSQAGLVQP